MASELAIQWHHSWLYNDITVGYAMTLQLAIQWHHSWLYNGITVGHDDTIDMANYSCLKMYAEEHETYLERMQLYFKTSGNAECIEVLLRPEWRTTHCREDLHREQHTAEKICIENYTLLGEFVSRTTHCWQDLYRHFTVSIFIED